MMINRHVSSVADLVHARRWVVEEGCHVCLGESKKGRSQLYDFICHAAREHVVNTIVQPCIKHSLHQGRVSTRVLYTMRALLHLVAVDVEACCRREAEGGVAPCCFLGDEDAVPHTRLLVNLQ